MCVVWILLCVHVLIADVFVLTLQEDTSDGKVKFMAVKVCVCVYVCVCVCVYVCVCYVFSLYFCIYVYG